MKRKKGFTLIELLAVIIILAVIALIAVPLVMSVINDAKKGAAVNSAYGFINALENSIGTSMIEDSNADYRSGNVTISGGKYYFNGTSELPISYKGTAPSSLSLVVSNGVVVDGKLILDGYTMSVDSIGSVTIIDGGSSPAPTTSYTLTVSANNNSYGSVTGGGTYENGANATLVATPNEGYEFVSWNDENTNATRTVTVTGDATYTATFQEVEVAPQDQSISEVSLGDYITLVPDASSYSITKAVTGKNSTQIISPNELTLWRVIAVNENGTVDAVSEYISSKKVTFYGVDGYVNAIGGLQTIASQYGKAGYTVAARIVGYDGQTSTIQDSSYLTNTSINVTQSTPTPTTGTGQEYNNGVRGDTLYLKDYLLVNNVYGSMQAMVVNTSNYDEYFLASRKYTYDGMSGTRSKYFDIREIASDGRIMIGAFSLQGYAIDQGDSTGVYYTNDSASAIRPIITIGADVLIDNGEGTKVSPYTLKK